MAIDSAAPRTRRAVIGAALGGAAAAAATSLAGPLGVQAATGGNVILGQGDDPGENEADAPTIVKNTTDAQVSLSGRHAAAGTGVEGTSVTGTGAVGISSDTTPTDFVTDPSHKTGVLGMAGDPTNASSITDETGVYGFSGVSSNSNGIWGDSASGTGVYGTGAWGVYGQGGIAVQGDAGTGGVGVYGWTGLAFPPAPSAGVGVYARAESTSQTALQVVGKFKFDRAGRQSLSSTQTSKKFTKTGVTSSSQILATLQTSVSGLYIRAVVPTTNAFTVYLSKAGGKTVYFSYMIING